MKLYGRGWCQLPRALAAMGIAAATFAAPGNDELFLAFAKPGAGAQPMVIWFWPGNDVTRSEIVRQLDLLRAAGIGGGSVVLLGPQTGQAPWLSVAWWQLMRFTAEEAKNRGMTIDLSAGYGWPNGGTFVRPEHRLQAISCASELVRGPQAYEKNLEAFLRPNDIGTRTLAFARLVPKELTNLDQVLDVASGLRDGRLRFTAPAGEWILYVGIHRSSAKRGPHSGLPGDFTLDHFSRAAVQDYLNHLAGTFGAAAGGRLGDHFRAFYVDSAELFPANWTTGLAAEFQRRRGYDLLPYAQFATGMYHIASFRGKDLRPDEFLAAPAVGDVIRRVRYDYSRTLVELFREHFAEPAQAWSRAQGLRLRFQAYGYPWHIGLGENYLVPDIPEGNNWILHDVPDHGWEVWNKYAAAGGHLTGRREISCEAMTTQKGKFHETLDRIKRADDLNFITGITRSVVHGFCYAPATALPPGDHKYGTFLSEHNPWWSYLSRWTAYNARISQVLQQAEPIVDVAILCPTADVWSSAGLNRVAQQTTPRYGYKLWESLSQQGLAADYLHEAVLQKAELAGGRLRYGPMSYSLLILCDVVTLERATAEAIRRYVEAGGQLVIVGQPPVRSPGLQDAAANDQRVQAALAAAVRLGGVRVTCVAAPTAGADLLAWTGQLLERTHTARRVVFSAADEKLFQVQYRAGSRDLFFLCNQDTERRIATLADFRVGGKTPSRWDPESGTRARYARAADGRLRIDLAPAESLLLVFEPEPQVGPGYMPPLVAGATMQAVETRWNLRLRSFRGDETTLADQPLVDLAQSATLRDFAGTVDYETALEPSAASPAQPCVLDLGRINGVSEAWLNGRPLGVRWYGLHHYDVTGRLQPGRNALRVRVATLLWNGVAGPKEPREAAGLAGLVLLRHGETRPTTP